VKELGYQQHVPDFFRQCMGNGEGGVAGLSTCELKPANGFPVRCTHSNSPVLDTQRDRLHMNTNSWDRVDTTRSNAQMSETR